MRLLACVLALCVALVAAASPAAHSKSSIASMPLSHIEALRQHALHVSGLVEVGHGVAMRVKQTARVRDPPDVHRPVDMRGTSAGIEYREHGKVLPHHLTTLTEGYHPLRGYFEQSPDCDQMMRLWLHTCPMKEAEENKFHDGPEPFFVSGKDANRESTSSYLKNVMSNWEASSDMVKATTRFAGKPKDNKVPADTNERDFQGYTWPLGRTDAEIEGAGGSGQDSEGGGEDGGGGDE